MCEVVYFGVFDEDVIIYIYKIDVDYGLCMQLWIGWCNLLYSIVIGKVLFVWMMFGDVCVVLVGIEFRKLIVKMLVLVDVVMSILLYVWQQGYGEDNEEQEDGLLCFVVLVFDCFGCVIVGLLLLFLMMWCGVDMKVYYVVLLKEVGQVIFVWFGYYLEVVGVEVMIIVQD